MSLREIAEETGKSAMTIQRILVSDDRPQAG